MRGQRAWHRAASARWGAAMRGGAEANLKSFCLIRSEKQRLDTIMASIVLKDPSHSSDITVGEPWRIRIPSPGEAAEEQNRPGNVQYYSIITQYEPFIGCLVSYLAGVKAPGSNQNHRETGSSWKSHFQNPPPMLNTLSSVFMRESRIQYLCDPQWFRDTASRGPTTIVAPESQFRTCPTGSCTTKTSNLSTRQMVTTWKVRMRVVR
ncbi:ATP-dependent DNA helicase Q-like 1 [Dorcoceras hygrometricum]|uniref:ATP-dependent DNA helicase Q-like 1 n=1 Tax=Dorcoceras hygrometricum TaxID=472368 RepID=A0A2Z7C882_9LAMI|nr:ATP-dependent DNA helicase Q-like 1 [Dorcoceras hygrometricum]